jgi:hypothetical protein
MSTSPIEHVLVLMLENRSFDHMLGFSGITGSDAATGQPTGLTGTETNQYSGQSYSPLLTLAGPRSDAPLDLGTPADSGVSGCPPLDFGVESAPQPQPPPPVTRPDEPVNEGNLAGVLQSALRSDLALSPAATHSKILARFSTIKTRAEARQYADTVRQKLRAVRDNASLGS